MQEPDKEAQRRLNIIEYIEKQANSIKAGCIYLGIPSSTYYRWRERYRKNGINGLKPISTAPKRAHNKIPKKTENLILKVREDFKFGPKRIQWYLERYYNIKISDSTVSRCLVRNGRSRLPHYTKKRSPGPSYKSYEKETPGQHIQMDVKFLIFKKGKKKIKRFQYTAIDDATRMRVLKVYDRHTQANAIDFFKYIQKKFPFKISMIRTDNGHEFQAQFHWAVLDQGIRHVYIRKGTPRLNGKVERSHRTDKEEFYFHLSYKNDKDLKKKVEEWQNLYNLHRPHGGLGGKTPYERLRQKMKR